MNLSRRGFLAGLLSSVAVAPVVAAVPAPLLSGELGVYEGVRIVSAPPHALTIDHIRAMMRVMSEKHIPPLPNGCYAMWVEPRQAREFGLV